MQDWLFNSGLLNLKFFLQDWLFKIRMFKPPGFCKIGCLKFWLSNIYFLCKISCLKSGLSNLKVFVVARLIVWNLNCQTSRGLVWKWDQTSHQSEIIIMISINAYIHRHAIFKLREASLYQIVCLIKHFQGDQTHVQQFMIKIFYNSRGFLAI